MCVNFTVTLTNFDQLELEWISNPQISLWYKEGDITVRLQKLTESTVIRYERQSWKESSYQFPVCNTALLQAARDTQTWRQEEKQREESRNSRMRKEEPVTERLAVRKGGAKWTQRIDQDMIDKLPLTHLSLLFNHWLIGNCGSFWFCRWGLKGSTDALVANVAPTPFVRSSGPCAQLRVQLVVGWGGSGRQHQSFERSHFCLQNINLRPKNRK